MKKRRLINITIFLLPALAVYTVFRFYPIVSGFYYGLTDWNGFSPNKNFIGLKNFLEIGKDTLIFTAIKNTIIFTIFVGVLQNGLSLLLAIMLDQKLKGIAFFRTVFFLPVLLSTAVVGFVWTAILNPVIGSWNVIFDFLGLHSLAKLDLLGNPKTALATIIFVVIWQYLGYSMVIYLSGLQNIPAELYEAVKIDGANGFQRFRHVTFPLLAPSLTINVILSTIGCFKQFDQVFVLTGGGPGDASQVIGTAIYKIAFSNNRFGYGVALSMLLFIAIAIISIVQMWVLKRREVEY